MMDHTSLAVAGKVSGTSMTSEGSYITEETLLKDIDGYIAYTAGDNILMEGTKTNGDSVTPFASTFRHDDRRRPSERHRKPSTQAFRAMPWPISRRTVRSGSTMQPEAAASRCNSRIPSPAVNWSS